MIVAACVLTSCGVDVTGTATTVVPVGPTDFATIPPVQSTLPNTTTSLPPGAVGVEQEYIVQAGDSPNLVAKWFRQTCNKLLLLMRLVNQVAEIVQQELTRLRRVISCLGLSKNSVFQWLGLSEQITGRVSMCCFILG